MSSNHVKPADKMKALLLDTILNRMIITGVPWSNCKISKPSGRGQPIIAEITPLMGITPFTFEIKVTQVVTRMKTGGKQARSSRDIDYDFNKHAMKD